ncbi:ABC transporter permease [Actinomadura parmotrematis]|uniref:ABC transporter permease subunit n=1 Tax=Actinomadura parmotrematis TaxID=2864039 RepID=A0ABS7G3D7_9ACTN|nr:ABC transporter permease subunit [Actinomadura parmotrematis]MBW8487214.1 ABC transporter permease subunit [Actinomadura parmotrematis]
MSAPRGRRRKAKRPLFPPPAGLLPLAVLLAAWQLLGDPHAADFPSPGAWIDAGRAVQDRGLLLPALGTTLLTFALALALATLAGAALGTLLGASPAARRLLGPLTEFLRNFPPPAAVPVAVLLIGTTRATTLAVVVAAALWPIALNTQEAIDAVPRVRIDAGRALGLGRGRQIASVIVPGVLPAVAVGVRIAAPICLIVVLLAEMLTSTGGVGGLVLERQRQYDSAGVFACLAIVGALGLLTSAAVGLAERVLLRHQPPDHAEGNAP